MTSVRPSLSPLIKWSGGKRSEIPVLKAAYPPHIERVVEPFAGGAAVAWALNAPHTILNDVSDDLVAFYRAVQDPQTALATQQAVAVVDGVRSVITQAVAQASDATINSLFGGQGDVLATDWIVQQVAQCVAAFPQSLQALLHKDLLASVRSKIVVRIPNLERKLGISFSVADKRNHLETALQAGVYTTLRRVYNKTAAATVTPAWVVASWYVVRLLCYAGMFRYGPKGDFNVPYGGIGYNSRNLATATAVWFAQDVRDFLQRTDVTHMDFEALFAAHNGFGPHDFIFVDPPYDSAFSQYNAQGDFTQHDQRRLADVLARTTAPWMLVIKNTPFVLGLYQHPHLHRGTFAKTYRVNLRNRHDRGVEHLVVTNYPRPASATDITPLP